MRLSLAQINPIVGDLEGNKKIIIEAWDKAEAETSDMLICPELALTGYFPEDLLSERDFLQKSASVIEELKGLSNNFDAALIIGAPYFDDVKNRLFNSLYFIHHGQIKAIQHKYNLPNYGVFDEKRYFSVPPLPSIVEFKNQRIGFLICEDFWEDDVITHLAVQNPELFIVINASPYCKGKMNKRITQAHKQLKIFARPLVYLNLIGGQDDLVFDGSSFAMHADRTIAHQMQSFAPDFLTIDYQDKKIIGGAVDFEYPAEPEEFYRACVLGLRDYCEKTQQNKVLLGLSGGIDSALVASIAVDALGANNVSAVMMPSPFTSQESLADAADCAKRMGIDYCIIPIENLMREFETTLTELKGTAHENMQARVRGTLLMSLSNQSGRMLLTTGNKSELATGYATLYGDMCGGYNPIKDLYKMDVFALADWRNKNTHASFKGTASEIIPPSIITKPPSAELRANQKDEDSLPPYDILDVILYGLIEEQAGADRLIASGFDSATVRKIEKLVYFAEYKRKQSPPGPKISLKAFTRERRFPIVNGYKTKN